MNVPVFCGRLGCSKTAIGSVVLRIWKSGDEQALEKTAPTCYEHRDEAEQAIIALHASLPPGHKCESEWIDGVS